MIACSQIEQLLADLERELAPDAWARIARVVGGIVNIYGAGLANTLACAREAGVDEAEFVRRLAEDELVAGLLVLHEIHPMSTEERVRRALVALPEIVAVTAIGDRIELQTMTTIAPELASFVRRTVAEVAPEVRTVEIVDERMAC